MKKCPYCGRENEDNIANCHECGTELICQSDTQAPGITACDRCGAKTDLRGAFFKQERSFRNPVTLCPPCWEAHRKWDYAKILIFRLSVGLLGILVLMFNHTDAVGWLLVNLFAFDLLLSLSILPHEFGHALAARWMGWRVFRIFIGSGKIVFKTTIAGFDTQFGALPLGGLVLTAPRQLDHFRMRLFVFALAGPMANLIIAGLAFAFLGGSIHGIGSVTQQLLPLHMAFFANLLIAIDNLIPREHPSPMGRHSTDGKKLWEAIRADSARQKKSHAGFYVLEGTIRLEKEQYVEAKPWLEQGLQLYPDNVQLQLCLGSDFLQLQQYEKARECFLKILQRSETEPVFRALAANNLAYTNILLDRPGLLPEADQYSVEALQALSWMPAIKGTRGTVLLELGRFEESIQLLTEAIEKHDVPNNKAQNACWLAIAEARKGNLDSGKKYLEQARKFDSTCFLLERAERAITAGTARTV